jgi:hypothetical protein
MSAEMFALQELTTDCLGFDIIQKSEHIGNIYLSVPNPYFRSLHISQSVSPIGIFYKICRRQGIEEPLIFRTIDEHSEYITLDKTYEINNDTGLLELPHEPHFLELRVYNKNNDLIWYTESSAFIRQIRLSFSVKEADLYVNYNGQKSIVEKYSNINKFVTEDKPSVDGFNYYSSAERKRKYMKQRENKEFIFFEGAKDEAEKTRLKEDAKNVIRDIFNRSRDSCYICDPYFSLKDIVDFAMHIESNSVKVNILNCKEFLNKADASQIVSVLDEYNKKPFNKIEVRMLRGKGILHDRFIVIDTEVWFVGSSFNEFGSRATCVAKVPESSDTLIVKEIEKWFNSGDYSEDIAVYASLGEDR